MKVGRRGGNKSGVVDKESNVAIEQKTELESSPRNSSGLSPALLAMTSKQDGTIQSAFTCKNFRFKREMSPTPLRPLASTILSPYLRYSRLVKDVLP
eukprot:5127098-Pleurochrysis_carterae.AAC.1